MKEAKYIYHMIPLMRIVQDRQIHRHKVDEWLREAGGGSGNG